MFSHITQNWRGRPLETVETIVNLTGSTTTRKGLSIRAALDRKKYETKKRGSSPEIPSAFECPGVLGRVKGSLASLGDLGAPE